MDCFHQTLVQVQIRLGPTNDNQDDRLSVSGIYGLLPSNSHSSSNMGFVRRTITQMAYKMAGYQCPLSWSLLVNFNQISSKIASFKLLFKFKYWFCPTNDNKDGRQNGHISVSGIYICTLTYFASIKLSFKFEYGFYLFTFQHQRRQQSKLLLM